MGCSLLGSTSRLFGITSTGCRISSCLFGRGFCRCQIVGSFNSELSVSGLGRFGMLVLACLLQSRALRSLSLGGVFGSLCSIGGTLVGSLSRLGNQRFSRSDARQPILFDLLGLRPRCCLSIDVRTPGIDCLGQLKLRGNKCALSLVSS